MGWVVQEHAGLYSKQYSWNAEFAPLVVSAWCRLPEG
jgi:hypothetical protein